MTFQMPAAINLSDLIRVLGENPIGTGSVSNVQMWELEKLEKIVVEMKRVRKEFEDALFEAYQQPLKRGNKKRKK